MRLFSSCHGWKHATSLSYITSLLQFGFCIVDAVDVVFHVVRMCFGISCNASRSVLSYDVCWLALLDSCYSH